MTDNRISIAENLIRAVIEGNAGNVDQLLRQGADPNGRDPEHAQTALMFASWRGDIETARILADHNCDVNATDDTGRTALMLAANRGKLDVARLLLERSAHPNAKSSTGVTPLMYAVMGGSREMVTLLLDAGASPLERDENDETAADLALAFGHPDLAKRLES